MTSPTLEAEAKRLGIIKPDPRDPDPSREGIFRDHNCWRCKDGALPCVKGKGRERDCDTLHARND